MKFTLDSLLGIWLDRCMNTLTPAMAAEVARDGYLCEMTESLRRQGATGEAIDDAVEAFFGAFHSTATGWPS